MWYKCKFKKITFIFRYNKSLFDKTYLINFSGFLTDKKKMEFIITATNAEKNNNGSNNYNRFNNINNNSNNNNNIVIQNK